MSQVLQQIHNIGISEDFDQADKRRAILINQIIFAAGITPFIFLPLILMFGEWINAIFTFLCGVVLLSTFLFSYSGKHNVAVLYFVGFAICITVYASLMFQNSSSDIFLIIVALIPYLTIINRKLNIAILFFIMLLFFAVNLSKQYFEPIAAYEATENKFGYISTLIAITLLIAFMLVRVKKLSQYYKDEIIRQKKITDKIHQDVLDSIKYAKRIQRAILPSTDLVNKCLPQSFIFYKPKDIVAGDFYWLKQINNKVLFAAADCTGHGVPGAMVSVVCNNGLNRSIREFKLTDPGQILDKTRVLVKQEFEKSMNAEINDGMDIALCVLDGNKLEYAGAHIPLWLIRKGEVLITPANKQPIGKYFNQLPYTTHTYELEKGDTLYIFSDGFPDQFGGEKDKKYKYRKFKKFLLSIQKHAMEKQSSLLAIEFETWKKNLEQTDDVCVIGVRI